MNNDEKIQDCQISYCIFHFQRRRKQITEERYKGKTTFWVCDTFGKETISVILHFTFMTFVI